MSDSENKLYVGKLNYETTVDGLYEHFGQFGKVVDAVVINDRETGRSRGFGFVTFENSSEVEACLGKEYQELDGREIMVNRPRPREQGGGGYRGGRGGGSYGGRGGGYGNRGYGDRDGGYRGNRDGGYQRDGGYNRRDNYNRDDRW